MRKLFYQQWWKWIGVIIMLYVLIAGFLVPLKPGVVNVTPDRLTGGMTTEVDIYLYNTNYSKNTSGLEAYIKLDSVNTLKASQVMIMSRKRIKAFFNPPAELPADKKFDQGTLVIVDPAEGYIVTPSAFTIVAAEERAEIGLLEWSDQIPVIKTEWKFKFPYRGILYETIRNTFFHVAIWMAMFILLMISLVYSVRYLITRDLDIDAVAASFTHVAVFFGLIGMATGSVWAKNTWGAYWTNDPKLNMSAVALMIYIAYSILRSSVSNDDRRAQLGAAYNIFAFVAMIPLIFIIPRMTSSLHPGNGGNPALGGEDLDNTLRLVFYPAIIGLTIIGAWLSTILYRIRRLQIQLIDRTL